jgi:plasmid stabilization system protein ParE
MARIHRFIRAERALLAQKWFDDLEDAILSLSELPQRCLPTPEDPAYRNLLFGKPPHTYRIIFSIDEGNARVLVHTVRHGVRLP